MNQLLLTPHSGYHWDRSGDRFFEGWYYRLTLPESGESFAFMYSIEDPQGGQANSGGAMQIFGPQDQCLCRSLPQVGSFWASPTDLAFGHWSQKPLNLTPQFLNPEDFQNYQLRGYQATAYLNQGWLEEPSSGKYCRWYYEIEPVYGWGEPHRPQKATGGLWSYLPIFEPGWQVLMALGLASGWIDWQGEVYHFEKVPAYSEKNWGKSFPQKWFWLNCISFPGQPDLTLTAAGGKRQVIGWQESVALIAIHSQGGFYQFAPWNAKVSWQIQPWGLWQMQGETADWQVTITAKCDRAPIPLRAPTAKGFSYCCWDTMEGELSLRLAYRGKTILEASSHLAALEVGGDPWQEPWFNCYDRK